MYIVGLTPMTPSSVSAAAKRFEKKAKNDKKISEMLGKIRKEIEGKNK